MAHSPTPSETPADTGVQTPPKGAPHKVASRTGTAEVPVSWFAQTLLKFTPQYLELAFLAICLRLLGLVEPFVFQALIDRVVPFERQASLTVVVLVLVGVALFQIAFELLSQILGLVTTVRALRALAGRLFQHLFQLPYRFFRGWPVGELTSRVGEIHVVKEFLIDTTTGAALNAIFVSIYLVVLFSLSPTLTYILLGSIPIQAAIYFGFGPMLRRRLRRQFDTRAHYQSVMVESLAGVAALKALAIEDRAVERLQGALRRSLDAMFNAELLSAISTKMLLAVEKGVTVLIIFIGARLVFEGSMTLGALVAFYLLAARVTEPIDQFARLWESWQEIRVSRQRLGDVLLQDMETTAQSQPLPEQVEARLTFEGVSFGYTARSLVLDQLDFEAAPHTLTLIVGPSGSGKSTLGRLSAGIEQPLAGRVLLGGLDIADYDPKAVRRMVSYVPQDAYLFAGTLRENLLIASPGGTDDDLRRVLDQAAATALVDRMPDGFDTMIQEGGAALSGGERQRLALARALVGRPPVIVLDEPTGALDAASEQRVAAGIAALSLEATVIVITHNPEVFQSASGGRAQVFELQEPGS